MKKSFTPQKFEVQNLGRNLTFHQVKFCVFLLSFLFLTSCSEDEIEQLNLETIPSPELIEEQQAVYKGIYASKTSNTRGTVELSVERNKNNPEEIFNGMAKLKLSTGQIVEARMSDSRNTNKTSEDFNAFFESDDIKFNFYLDEFGEPVITDVVFKQEQGSIVVAEHTADAPVVPVTGIYRCTNCEDQTSTLKGIELHNDDRIFNMLLTSKDGQTGMTIQAVMGSLINAELVVEQACTTDGGYTFCNLQTGTKATTEPVQWSGIHRYTSDASAGDACSTIWGDLIFNSPENGIIEAEFMSDNTCANNTYYVSAAGDDSNSGLTPDDAWRTIDKVNSIVVKPGDAVLFEGGKSFNGSLNFDSNDANGGSNTVTISSYGSGKATISSGLSNGFMAYNTAGIIVDNLIFSGTAITTTSNSGVYFYTDLPGDVKLDFVRVTNCEVFGYRDSGIVIGAWNGNSGFNDILIENNKVHDVLDAGISSYGEFSQSKIGYAHSNLIVRGCEVYNIPGYDKGNNSGNGIVLSDVQHSVIEYCTAYDSGHGNVFKGGGPVGIWYWDSDHVTIQHNEVYGMKSGTKDGGGFDLDGGVTNGLMQYNYSHDNYGAGYLIGQFGGARPMRNITVRYNISENDAATNGGSIYLFNGSSPSSMKDIHVYNNTLYIEEKYSSSAAIKLLEWKTINENVNFHNNIIFAENGADLVQVPSGYHANFSGNLYHTTGNFNIAYKGNNYASLSAFRSTGNEIIAGKDTGVQADPLLNNAGNGGIIGFGKSLKDLAAYKIQTGSPAINAGIILSVDMGDKDFYGNTILTDPAPEVGAHGNLSQEAVVSN